MFFFFFFFQFLLISIIFVNQYYHLHIAKYNSQLNWWPLPTTSPGVKTFLVLIIRSSKLNITCRKAFVLSKFKKKMNFKLCRMDLSSGLFIHNQCLGPAVILLNFQDCDTFPQSFSVQFKNSFFLSRRENIFVSLPSRF